MADNCRPLGRYSGSKDKLTDSFIWPRHWCSFRKRNCVSQSEVEFEYYVELFSSVTIPEFKGRIDSIIMHLGFSDYAFVRVVSSVVDPGNFITMSTSVPDSIYIGGLYGHDILYPYEDKCVKSIFKSTVNKNIRGINESLIANAGNVLQSNVMAEAYFDYYNIPIVVRNGLECAVLSVTQRDMKANELNRKIVACKETLKILCAAIDLVASRKFSSLLAWDGDNKSQNLCSELKPLWVLKRFANNDLTIDQIAACFKVDVTAIQEILKNIRRAFGVRTNYAAIKQAVLIGLIDFS